MYERYFAGVRWSELVGAFAVGLFGRLGLVLGNGGELNRRAWLEAAVAGAVAAGIYLREPKRKDGDSNGTT